MKPVENAFTPRYNLREEQPFTLFSHRGAASAC